MIWYILIWEWNSPVDMIQYDKTWNYLDWYGNLAHRWIWSATLSASRCWLEGWLAPHTGSEKKMIDWKKRRFLMFYSSMCIYISCAKPYNLDWDLRIDFQEHLSMWSRLRIIISWIHETKTKIRYILYFQTMQCIDDHLGYMLLYKIVKMVNSLKIAISTVAWICWFEA